MVPYLTAFVPLAPVAHIPQIDAFAPGSTGNHSPETRISLSLCQFYKHSCLKLTVVLKVMVKGLSRNARLDHNIKVFRVIVEDLVHSRDVNAEAAVNGRDPSLQASSGSKGNNWDPVSVAQLANLKKEKTIMILYMSRGWKTFFIMAHYKMQITRVTMTVQIVK